MLQPGTTLDHDRYRIEAVIGQGGFGYVYRAHERLTGETIAIKELVPSFVDDEKMVQRFIQEARTTLRLSHPHIVRTHNIFRGHGTYYLTMEYLAGGSLADRLRHRRLPVGQAVSIASDLCEALVYAHGEGIIHCDIKPANVLFAERGRVHLADFGIAHVSKDLMTRQFFTATGTAMGTVRYMAPEQLEGVRDDPRVDIYAVGAVLYEMLSGRPYLDFETESTPAAQMRNIRRIQSDQPRPLDRVTAQVPKHLVQAVERALSKSPGQRFATADSLKRAIQGHEAPTPRVDVTRLGEAERTQTRTSTSSWLARMPVPLWAAGILIAVGVSALVFWQGVGQLGLGSTHAPVATFTTGHFLLGEASQS